jgi:hypothetical protein
MSRSVGFSVFAALGFAAYFSQPAHAAGADPQHYYFCETTNSFFPYVQTCSVPWKEVDPRPTAIVASAQAPVSSAPPAAPAVPAADPPPKRVIAFPIGMPPPQNAVATVAAPAAPVPNPGPVALAPGPVPLTPEPGVAKGPVVFAFGDETPVIVCAVSQLCDVSLQSGERVNQIIVGDPDHWKIETVAEGAGYSETTHLIVRPTNPDLDTSLIVFTKMRTYHMQLKSHRKDYMLQVAFSYPGQAEAAVAKPVAEKAVEKVASDDSDDGLVKAGGITYVKGREPKMLVPKSAPGEPPLPAAAPAPDVTEVPVSHSKVQPMPQ